MTTFSNSQSLITIHKDVGIVNLSLHIYYNVNTRRAGTALKSRARWDFDFFEVFKFGRRTFQQLAPGFTGFFAYLVKYNFPPGHRVRG